VEGADAEDRVWKAENDKPTDAATKVEAELLPGRLAEDAKRLDEYLAGATAGKVVAPRQKPRRRA
jgi:hypothetical protein